MWFILWTISTTRVEKSLLMLKITSLKPISIQLINILYSSLIVITWIKATHVFPFTKKKHIFFKIQIMIFMLHIGLWKLTDCLVCLREFCGMYDTKRKRVFGLSVYVFILFIVWDRTYSICKCKLYICKLYIWLKIHILLTSYCNLPVVKICK